MRPFKKLFFCTSIASILLTYGCKTNIAKEPEVFNSSWQSLERYQCPEWFRDAKFGIWSHWNGYVVPEQGDWYARDMYIQGSAQYEYHVKNYGHPSKFGYKDVIEMWKADKFNADSLVALYKEAGAKYIVSLAVHHDNFDLWDSKYQKWNSVNNGPHKNIVGLWEKAVRKAGLRWGVTSHLERSWNWMQVSHEADTAGPYKGVPYDGANPAYKQIYHDTYGIKDDNMAYAIHPPKQWADEYCSRIKDLMEQHKPDMFYMDGAIPFGSEGRELIAWYYNQNTKWHNGSMEAAMAIKNLPYTDVFHGDFRYGTCVEDIERGRMEGINREPWQTDNSIGDWSWKKGQKYISLKDFVDQLIDIVSKNGNLLMNIPLRADGSIDQESIELLKGIGQWLKVNGDGIYGTRPYSVFGEGPTVVQGGHKVDMAELTANDFRFTTRGDTVFAFICGEPTGEVKIRQFNQLNYHTIQSINMLGVKDALKFSQEKDGTVVQMPESLPSKNAVCLKIVPKIDF
jgi:alpha-L-fucosidase